MKLSLLRITGATVFGALFAGGGYLGYRSVRSDIAAAAYRERLAALADQYETLRRSYNQAVRKTAVTELLVKDGKLSIAIRAADGSRRVIETRLEPRHEIYVDYVVLDGRLLIRRVFDSWTPPMSAMTLDQELEEIDWNDPRADHGKAVYRSLSDGRWIISVTGSGSLGLVRLGDVGDTPDADLERAPEVRDYSEIVQELDAQIDAIGARDVWRWATRD